MFIASRSTFRKAILPIPAAQIAVIVTLTVLSSLWIGLFAGSGYAILLLALSMAMLAAIVFYWRPELGVVLYIFLTVTVLNVAALPTIKVPVLGQFYVTDMALVYVLVIVILRDPRLGWARSPLTLPLLAYWLVRVLAVAYSAILVGDLRVLIVQLGRAELPLLTFFAFLGVARQHRSWESLLRYLLVGGIGMSIFYFYAAITRNQELLSAPLLWLRPDVDVTRGEVPRIVTLGIPIVYPLFFLAMAWSLSGTTTKVRLWSLLLSVLCAALIVFHGFRGEWYATAGALPVIVVLSAVGQRKVIGKGLLLVAIAVGLVAMLGILSPYVFAYSPVESVIDRALSPFEIGGADSSLTSRLEEVQWAWPQILVRPILGWGVAVPVNPVLLRLGMVAYGVHSGYMYLLLNYGFVGLVASLWLMASYFRYAWRTLGLVQNTSQRALIVGFMGYTAHMLLTGFINTGFAGASGMVLLSIGFVLTVVLGERARQASIAASAVQCSPQKSLLAPRS